LYNSRINPNKPEVKAVLAEERRQLILRKLARDGQIRSAELIKEFNFSEDTIRRDLKDLADAGLLKKVHGGAMASTSVPYAHAARVELNVEAKSALAQKATTLIKDGMLVFVDGGTTTAQIANHLSPALQLRFITHSIPTALALSALPRAKVILLGGQIIPELLIASGPDVIEQARHFRPDLAIVSVHGITASAGATVESFEDASTKRKLIENSAEVVVLAGLEKVGFVASYAVATIAQIDYLISDAPVKMLQPFEEGGITVLAV
jgi:DeoR/GlpR family transcriptional regulator of sugar metabolism